jgi:hypothetical protein
MKKLKSLLLTILLASSIVPYFAHANSRKPLNCPQIFKWSMVIESSPVLYKHSQCHVVTFKTTPTTIKTQKACINVYHYDTDLQLPAFPQFSIILQDLHGDLISDNGVTCTYQQKIKSNEASHLYLRISLSPSPTPEEVQRYQEKRNNAFSVDAYLFFVGGITAAGATVATAPMAGAAAGASSLYGLVGMLRD